MANKEDDLKKRTDGSSIVRSKYTAKDMRYVNEFPETCLLPSVAFRGSKKCQIFERSRTVTRKCAIQIPSPRHCSDHYYRKSLTGSS